MTWQEELRELDSALAGGEVTASEYRKRRDEILAAASSAQQPSPVIGAPDGSPPEADNGAAARDEAEVTQVVNIESNSGHGDADVTQIISNPGQANGGTADTGERTPPTAQPLQWSSLPPTQNAPTGVASFPPVPQQHMPAVTPMDAHDLFASNKPPKDGKKPLLIVLAAVLVLAIAGGAVWFFAFREDGAQTADGDTGGTTEQTTQAPPPPPVDITKIELPGEPAQNSGEMDITRASELKVIAPAEASMLVDAGAKDLTYSAYSEGSFRYLLYAYKTESPAAAQELAEKMQAIQKRLGYQSAEVDGAPAGVTLTTVSNDAAASLRGVYTYGDTTIQLSVLQVPVGDTGELHAQFLQAMTAVTDAAPPAE